MNALAKVPAALTAQTLQPIPYQTESPVTTAKLLSVVGMTAALLIVTVGVLLWARRRGWLRRWSIASASTADRDAPRVLGQARLGQASHVFLIEAGGSRFVVVESSRHVSMQAASVGRAISAVPGEGDE